MTPASTTPASTSPATPPDRRLPTPAFPPPRRRPGVRGVAARAWRRGWPWLAAVLAVVLVVVTELGLLQTRLRADLARLHDAGGVPAAAPAAVPTLPPLPVVAPAADGDVTGVRLRVLHPPCASGGGCTLLVGVERRPGAPATPTPWTVLAVDRCRGGATPVGTGVTADDGYGLVTVALPPGAALAVAAVTTGPARAASVALPIGAGPC
jgi:hypothetical protein